MNSKTIIKELHQIAFDTVTETSSSVTNDSNKANVEWIRDLNGTPQGPLTRNQMPLIDQAGKSLQVLDTEFKDLRSKDQSDPTVIRKQLDLLHQIQEHQNCITVRLSVDANQGQLTKSVTRTSQLVDEMKSKLALVLVQNL